MSSPIRGVHALYDPTLAKADVERLFGEQLRVGAEIVAECSNLLLRAFQSSEARLVDIVALGHFYRALVVAADGCLICLQSGAAEQALLHTRKAFEAGLQLQWLLRSDSDSRARRFYTWHLREERSWYLRAIPGSVEHEEHKKAWEAQGDAGPPLDPIENQSLVDEINNVLAKEDYREANALFDAAREAKSNKGRRPTDPLWFSVGDGAQPTLAALATSIGRRTDYRTTYRYLSYATHSSSLASSARIRDAVIRIEHVRIPRHFSTAFIFAFAEWLHRSLEICEMYRPGEGVAFATRLRDQWFKHIKAWYNVEMGESS
ncbi:MAG: DUF5677 domain-containing protein [Gemmatimonadaceae bacterium]|jgi:hypothetical protein